MHRLIYSIYKIVNFPFIVVDIYTGSNGASLGAAQGPVQQAGAVHA